MTDALPPTDPAAATSQLDALLEVAAVFADAPVGIAVCEIPGYRYRHVNSRYTEFSHVDMTGKVLVDVFPQTVAMGFSALFDQVVESGEAFVARGVQSFLPDTGQLIFFDLVFQPLFGAGGQVVGILQVLDDVTVRETQDGGSGPGGRNSAVAARHEARPGDHLTGLGDRQEGEERLRCLIDACEESRTSAWVLFVDLDGFKIVNDVGGHALGDAVLVELARRLADVDADGVSAFRMGGDEFLLCVEDRRGRDEVDALVERVVDSCRQPVERNGQRVNVSASVGVAEIVPLSGESPTRLLRDVDVAMYRAKRAGGDQAVAADGQLRAEAMRQAAVLHELRDGVEARQIRAAFQPIVDLRSGRIVGVEALARWHHPRRGVLDAVDFLDDAERGGLLVAVGERVIADALRVGRGWLDDGLQGPSVGSRSRLFLNVSAQQFGSASLQRQLGALGELAGYICLELTETELFTPTVRRRSGLEDLRATGVGLAVDDFGTGFSSLAYLQELRPDVVKLDGRFVRGMVDGPVDRAIVSSVAQITAALGVLLIAEGVETEAQRELAAELGCDAAQGYHLGRPMSAEEMTALLRAERDAAAT